MIMIQQQLTHALHVMLGMQDGTIISRRRYEVGSSSSLIASGFCYYTHHHPRKVIIRRSIYLIQKYYVSVP